MTFITLIKIGKIIRLLCSPTIFNENTIILFTINTKPHNI